MKSSTHMSSTLLWVSVLLSIPAVAAALTTPYRPPPPPPPRPAYHPGSGLPPAGSGLSPPRLLRPAPPLLNLTLRLRGRLHRPRCTAIRRVRRRAAIHRARGPLRAPLPTPRTSTLPAPPRHPIPPAAPPQRSGCEERERVLPPTLPMPGRRHELHSGQLTIVTHSHTYTPPAPTVAGGSSFTPRN